MRTLETDTDLSGNISSRKAVAAYTATYDVLVMVRVHITAIANSAANMTVEYTVNDDQSDVVQHGIGGTEPKRVATDTSYGRMIGPIALENTDELTVYVTSTNTNDTTADTRTKFIDISPVQPATGGDLYDEDSIADALLDRADAIEPVADGTERTVREALRIILSAAGGPSTGATETTANFRDLNDTKDRITATVDSNGNRSSVVYDDS